jgi:D-alanine-D-alanine ligase-like ATP-grasp enzyme
MSKKVAVLRGGTKEERQKSLEFGKEIINLLKVFQKNNTGINYKLENEIEIKDIVIHPNGAFTVDGYVEDIEKIIPEIDLVWNALIGYEGEKGVHLETFENQNKKIIGHDVFFSRISNDKKKLQEIVNQYGILTPYSRIVEKKNYNIHDILENFKFVGIPSIIKPLDASDLKHLDIITHYEDLIKHAEKIIHSGHDVLIEKKVEGISVAVFVYEINNSIETSIYLHRREDWAKIKKEELVSVRNEALKIHHSLGFDFHVEYDFIINKKGIYFIEANTYPSLTHDFIKDIWDKNKSLQEYVNYHLNKFLN